MLELLSVEMNALAVSAVGIGIDYWCLSQLYNRRNRATMWWTYFLLKILLGAFLSYMVDRAGAGSPYETINQIWTYSTAVLSYGVVLYTWSGDGIEVGLMAVASDLFAGLCTMTGMMVANLSTGREASTSKSTTSTTCSSKRSLPRRSTCIQSSTW